MEHTNHWYAPQLIRRVRIAINFIIILIVLLILYINHEWLLRLLSK
ncbi:MAG: hypothetical protein ACK4HE_11375 [Chitinophagaceae bacterium]